MGRERQFVDGEGRFESPRHTGVLVCKQNVRKTKQNKKQNKIKNKKAVLSGVKGEFTGWGRGTCLSSQGRAFRKMVLHTLVHTILYSQKSNPMLASFFLKHLE